MKRRRSRGRSFSFDGADDATGSAAPEGVRARGVGSGTGRKTVAMARKEKRKLKRHKKKANRAARFSGGTVASSSRGTDSGDHGVVATAQSQPRGDPPPKARKQKKQKVVTAAHVHGIHAAGISAEEEIACKEKAQGEKGGKENIAQVEEDGTDFMDYLDRLEKHWC